MSNPMTGFHPPFDGKDCPCCPEEIRDLFATAYNVVHGSGPTLHNFKVLRQAVDNMESLMNKHFADPMHSHGRKLL